MAQQNENQIEFDRMHQWFVDMGFEEAEWWQHPDHDWRQEHAVQGYFDNEDQRVQDYVAECQRIRANIEMVRNSDLFEPFRNSVDNCVQSLQDHEEPNQEDKLALFRFFRRYPYIISELDRDEFENFREYIRRMVPTLSSRPFWPIDINARHETLQTIDNINEFTAIVWRGRNLAMAFIFEIVRQWFINWHWNVDWWEPHDNAWRVDHAPADYFANEEQTIEAFTNMCTNWRQEISNEWNTAVFQEFRDSMHNIRISIVNNAPENPQDVLVLRNYLNLFPNTLQQNIQVRLNFRNNLREIVPTLSSRAYTRIENIARWQAYKTKNILDHHINMLTWAQNFRQQKDRDDFDEVQQWFIGSEWEEAVWWQHPFDHHWRQVNAPHGYFVHEGQAIHQYEQVCLQIRQACNAIRNSNAFRDLIIFLGNYFTSIHNNEQARDEDVFGVISYFDQNPGIFPELEIMFNNLNLITRAIAPTLSSRTFLALDIGARHNGIRTRDNLYELYNFTRDARGNAHQLLYQVIAHWFQVNQWPQRQWFNQIHDEQWIAANAPPGYFENEIQHVHDYAEMCGAITEQIHNDRMNMNGFQEMRNAFVNINTNIADDVLVQDEHVNVLRNFFQQNLDYSNQYRQRKDNFDAGSQGVAATLSSMAYEQIDINARWIAFRTLKMLYQHVDLLNLAEVYSILYHVPDVPPNGEQIPP